MEQDYLGTTGSETFIYWNGGPYSLYRSTSGGVGTSLQYDTGKVSVDSGKFVPGEYRINPYSVKGGMVSVTEDQACEIWSPPFYYGGRNPLVVQRSYTTGNWMSANLIRKALDRTPAPNGSVYKQLALQKARSKVANADLELGETLGEYKETIQMLRNPLSNLRKHLVDDRSRNLNLLKAFAKKDKRQINRLMGRTGKASAKTAASTWLEVRYGLRPLIGLVQDAVDLVNNKRNQVFDPTKIRSARTMLNFPSISTSLEQTDSRDFSCRSNVIVEQNVQATASVQYTSEYEDNLFDRLGLSPQFLPETLWNLTRASFIVDWIFTVGPWLGSLRYNPGVKILGNTVGIKTTRKATTEVIEIANTGVNNWTKAPCKAHGNFYSSEQYVREVNVDLSYLPHFTWGRTLDIYKAVDAALIAWQFRK